MECLRGIAFTFAVWLFMASGCAMLMGILGWFGIGDYTELVGYPVLWTCAGAFANAVSVLCMRDLVQK